MFARLYCCCYCCCCCWCCFTSSNIGDVAVVVMLQQATTAAPHSHSQSCCYLYVCLSAWLTDCRSGVSYYFVVAWVCCWWIVFLFWFLFVFSRCVFADTLTCLAIIFPWLHSHCKVMLLLLLYFLFASLLKNNNSTTAIG